MSDCPEVIFELPTLQATRELACRVASLLELPMTVALVGELGSGKTQFVRYLVAELGGNAASVTSPTYVLQQIYNGRCRIHHFDFYRLEFSAQVWDLGIDELCEQPCLLLVEWAGKFPECLPDDCLTLTISQLDADSRQARISGSGPRARRIVTLLAK